MQASSALFSCVGSAIQTNLTIVFLLVAQHNSNKFDSALTPSSVDSAFALASVDCPRLLAKLFVNTHQASQVSFLLSPILLLEVTPKAIIANPRSGTLFYHCGDSVLLNL